MTPGDMPAQAASALPMVVLRPGDRVLVCLTGEVDQDTSNEIAYALRRSFPGTDFTVLSGVAGVAVAGGKVVPGG